ncbi:MAG: helix-turn-helix domain-containing protein [Ignavibacteria bacterium]|nr:helix-turn-helix domain-containing protein [Ignavibacteria bacterium]
MTELIFKLRSLGFTDNESKIFLALLQGRILSATEVAKAAKVTRTDVYTILKSFVDKGYCNEIETNSILKYEMIDPEVILGKIQLNLEREKEKKSKAFDETFNILKPLYNSKSEKPSNSNIELIRGYNKQREIKFYELLKNAKKEILFMVRLELFISDDVDQTAAKFIKNGGVIKSIYEVGGGLKVRKDDKWIKAAPKDLMNIFTKFENYGEQVRVSTLSIPNYTIIDREIVFMNIVDKSVPKYNEADIIIRNKEFAESHAAVFFTLWEKAQTLKEYKMQNKF